MAGEPESLTNRPARPAEKAALVDLWVAANPGTDPAAWDREYARVPDRFAHTLVAEAPGGELLAAAVWWPRRVRDAAGAARLVGNVSHVATRPEARRRGHATRLMALAEEAMREAGCVWAALTTSEEARALYERLGWRAYPRSSWQGLLSEPTTVPGDYAVAPYDPHTAAEGWAPLARLYDAANARRPGSVVRPLSYWGEFLGPRAAELYDDHQPLLLVAARPPDPAPRGYAWVLLSNPEAPHPPGLSRLLTVAEIGVRPGDEAAIAALVEAVKAAAGPNAAGRLVGPATPALADAATALFGSTLNTVTSSELMARPLAGIDQAALDALYAAPEAVSWPLDEL